MNRWRIPVRRLLPWSIVMVWISVMVLIWSGVQLYKLHCYHAYVKQKAIHPPTFFSSHETPYALFANAVRYGYQGQHDKSLSLYAKVVAITPQDHVLHKAAHFNAGNVYLRLATDKLEKEGLPAWDVAGPLVALAKESYQKSLRLNPDWSEAKYNYQLALRLAPTAHGMRGPQQYEDDTIKQEEKPSGWPAMPGNPRGMP